MTQNIFNIYSAEAFSQHPMALWSLDDDFSYLSLISANPSYSITNGEPTVVSNPPTEKPQETVGVADISLNINSFIGYGNSSEIRTQNFSVPDDIDSEKPTVCVSSFIYPYDTDIAELEIGFEYKDPLFVTIATGSNEAAYSTDGTTWSATTMPYVNSWRSITHGNNVFVAVPGHSHPPSAAAAYSTDGIIWFPSTLPSNSTLFSGDRWTSVSYGNNTFVTVARFRGSAAYSTDGIIWSHSTMPFDTDWWSTAYGNNTFVAIAGLSQGAAISTNGILWSRRTMPLSVVWSKIIYGNEIFTAISYTAAAATSTDGSTWTIRTMPSSQNWISVAYGNNTFVAVAGLNSSAAATSTDGITWIARTMPQFTLWRDIAYGNYVFVVPSPGSTTAAVSTDGATWTIKFLPSNVSWISIAYKEEEKNTKKYKNLELNTWEKIEHTINLPDLSTPLTPYINVKHYGEEKTYSLYQTSVGQWSEQFNHETQGIVPIPFENISASSDLAYSIGGTLSASPNLFGTRIADVYGLSDKYQGYYLIENNRMLSRNTKLPMVFGSGDITEIYPSSYNVPSIIFPGRGFLHNDGKYKEITAEFWLKIYPQVTEKTKIFGPVASQDGLYVDKEFLILRIGPYEKSYFINKWYRPMLVDIRYTELFISVMINGEVVIEQPLISRDIDFPESNLYNNDWIGFYSTNEIEKFEIDCVSIYPYIVQEQLAKKKFVYGQGVGPANQVTRKFGSTSLPIDFPFATYSQNIIYPDMTKWFSGFYSNIEVDSKFITLPNYNLPEIKYLGNDLSDFNVNRQKRTWEGIKSKTWLQWISSKWSQISSSREIEPLFDSFSFQENREDNFYIKLKPISTYDNVYGSIVFNSLNIISDPVQSIFGLFSLNSAESEEIGSGIEATIMHFKNNSTGDIFKIIYEKDTKEIKYVYNSTTIKSFSFIPQENDTHFITGIKLDDLTRSYAKIIRRFFSIPQNIRLNVGGNEQNQFPGKIYRMTFNNNFFTKKDLSNYFDENGIANYNDSISLLLSDDPFNYEGNYTMFFKKSNSSLIMDIAVSGYWEDSIPLSSLGTYVRDHKGRQEIYDLDFLQFNIDYPNSILAQDNFDIQENLKTYITLQNYEDVGSIVYGNYINTKELNTNRYIDFDNVETNIDTTKFNVENGTIIFAPKNIINFNNAYITIHMELKSPGINTSPIKIQRMSIASLAYDEKSLYPINTPTGQSLYPFSRQGTSYINKAKNPFLIYKDSTPYLYLTGDSGIQSLPYPEIDDISSESFRRGISVPLNKNKKEDYTIYGIHMWSFYNKSNTFNLRERMFSVSYRNIRYDFYLEPEVGGKRAKIVPYLYDPDYDILTEDIEMFQNGIKQNVYVYPLTWSLVTLRFINPIDLSSIIGQLELYPGTVFNNITIFEQDIEKRVDDIFESHLGLSNIVAQDSSTLSVNFDQLNIFSDIKWATFGGKPV